MSFVHRVNLLVGRVPLVVAATALAMVAAAACSSGAPPAATPTPPLAVQPSPTPPPAQQLTATPTTEATATSAPSPSPAPAVSPSPAPTATPAATPPAPAPTSTPAAIEEKLSIINFNLPGASVPVGTKVLWINMDDAPHTVTHGAPPSSFGGEFRSNSLSRGDGFSHTFNTPGTFNYFCEIHPSLRGRIVVTSGAAPTATPVPAAPTPVPPPTPTSTPAPATPAPTEAKVSSSIYDFRLTNLTVKVGTTVTWTNADPEQHTVTHGTSPNAEGLFSSPVLKQSDSYSYTFTQAGAFPYFCAIHTDMTATVNVTP